MPSRWFCCRNPLVSTVTFSNVDALIAYVQSAATVYAGRFSSQFIRPGSVV